MAAIKPVPLNPSQALITPGYPLASVPASNPIADKQLAEGTTSTPTASKALKTSLTQSSHLADGVDI